MVYIREDNLYERIDDDLFGRAYFYNRGNYETISKLVNTKFKNKYDKFPKYYYDIYKFEKDINAPTHVYSPTYYLTAGGEYETEITHLVTEEITFETSMKSPVTKNVTGEANGKVSLSDKFSGGVKISGSITWQDEYENKFSHKYVDTSSIGYKENVGPYDHDTWWRLETRANFEAFKIYVYEINYNRIVTSSGSHFGVKWYKYGYNIESYKLVETSFVYSFITGSEATGLYEYKPCGSRYQYIGPQMGNINYIL